MTANPVPDETPEGLITIEAPKPTATVGPVAGDRTPFQLTPCCTNPEACTHTDGDPSAEVRNGVLWAIRPKNMLLMLVAGRVEEGKQSTDLAPKMPGYRTFLDACVEAETNDIIWARLGDPTDALDEPDMDALLSTFLTKWVPGRPTQPSAGSASLPRGTGRPTTGRSRSTAKTRSS